MKKKTSIIRLGSLLILMTPLALRAHCPANLPEEKLCFMLDSNVLYLYDQKLEHNGPYKDLKTAELISIKNAHSSSSQMLSFNKIARGIYKIESATKLEIIQLAFKNKNKQTLVQVRTEGK